MGSSASSCSAILLKFSMSLTIYLSIFFIVVLRSIVSGGFLELLVLTEGSGIWDGFWEGSGETGFSRVPLLVYGGVKGVLAGTWVLFLDMDS